MADLVMRRVGSRLEPVAEVFEEILRGIPEGRDIMVTTKRPRSLPHHRLFWSLMHKIAQGTEYNTAENLVFALKLAVGFADVVRLPNGKTAPKERSLSFSETDQDTFRAFFDSAMRVVEEYILPGIENDPLVAEIHALLDNRRAA